MNKLVTMAVVGLMAACGVSESTPKDSGTDTGATDTGTDTGTTDTGSTTICEAFDVSASRVQASGETVFFTGQQQAGETVDVIMVEMFGQAGGPRAVGTYAIDGTKNYSNCALCVLVAVGCDQQTCQAQYYATAGTVTVDQYSNTEGETATVTVTDLELIEVTSASDYTSTPVPGGGEMCISTATVSGQIEAAGGGTEVQTVEPYATPSDLCVTDGNGNGLGNNVTNMVFQTCSGETVDLHQLYCGQGDKAIWLATSAEWCGPCKQYDPIFNDLANKNEAIDFYVLLGQDSAGGTTNIANECSAGFGYPSGSITTVPASHVLIDADWAASDAGMNNYGAAGIPYGRVVAGENMQYVWTEYANDGVSVAVDDALKAASGLDEISGWSEFVQTMNSQ